jgi:hypothetical protein
VEREVDGEVEEVEDVEEVEEVGRWWRKGVTR